MSFLAPDWNSLTECSPRDKVRLGFNVSQSFIRNNYFTPRPKSTSSDLQEREKIFKIDPRIKKKKVLLRRIGKKANKRAKKYNFWNWNWIESIHFTKKLFKQTHLIYWAESWDWDWGEERSGVVLKPGESRRTVWGEYNSDWNTITGLGFYICQPNDWDWGLSRIQCRHFPLYSYSSSVLLFSYSYKVSFS